MYKPEKDLNIQLPKGIYWDYHHCAFIANIRLHGKRHTKQSNDIPELVAWLREKQIEKGTYREGGNTYKKKPKEMVKPELVEKQKTKPTGILSIENSTLKRFERKEKDISLKTYYQGWADKFYSNSDSLNDTDFAIIYNSVNESCRTDEQRLRYKSIIEKSRKLIEEIK